jgi:diaminopimelate epimerase
MSVKFDKMQALGNDFVMIDFNQFSPDSDGSYRKFIPTVCNRNYGIGCDTLVLYKSENDEIFAKFFNPNGTEAEICGNAARCLGLLMKKRNGASQFTLRTKKKIYPILVTDSEICVNMGQPSFNPEEIGFLGADQTSLRQKLDLPSEVFHVSCISVGNPHLVLFCEKILDEEKITELGASLENHSLFKNKINVSFAHITHKNEIALTVFERGVGLTLACGSGACATAAAAFVNRIILSKKIFVKQKGGELMVHSDDDLNIFQTGPASYVFSGEIDL